jgi:hypothetical protein
LAASDAAEAMGMQRQIELVTTWLGSPASREEPWAEAAFSTDNWMRLNPDELAELGRELQEVIGRYRGRPDDPHREPVFVLARGFPARP